MSARPVESHFVAPARNFLWLVLRIASAPGPSRLNREHHSSGHLQPEMSHRVAVWVVRALEPCALLIGFGRKALVSAASPPVEASGVERWAGGSIVVVSTSNSNVVPRSVISASLCRLEPSSHHIACGYLALPSLGCTGPMHANELRKIWTDFFSARGHTPVASAGLIPHHPSAPMFTNSGMMQFVPYFLGEEACPYDPPRASSVQRCVRAGGKHNDLDAIGRSPRHLSFFEMMGNFSVWRLLQGIRNPVGMGVHHLHKGVGWPRTRR